ncbi:Oidioi.mRNA.OKI2018_I69.chr1.g818.t1.cds [Oikopleura dioica]|uniref:Oidioi.mRNA.OKI2018_I69.chr1.g818.t1.cds n=1 Tax=Oikopleura dioica TaxID=34765 RepID=A0ABN7SQB7_OIKDI|nr:Oidioi.mRNA.OKI2018_I69.chr1.g818.t1.cds [Oikopleura dioica]
MKGFSFAVFLTSAFAGKIVKCNNVIIFLEENGIRAENRVHRRISLFKSQLFPLVKDRASSCSPELQSRMDEMEEAEELDDVGHRMTFETVGNKISLCADLWDEYIQRKLPFDVCPKANNKANRKLRRFTSQLLRGSHKAHVRTVLES